MSVVVDGLLVGEQKCCLVEAVLSLVGERRAKTGVGGQRVLLVRDRQQ